MLSRFRRRRPARPRAFPAAALALGLFTAIAALAQDLPPDPDAALVEELVVTARYPGPAFWRVSRGEARVWVLGVPSLAPKRQEWDRQLFSRYLAASGGVILPFNGLKVRLAGSPSAAVGYLRLKSARPFEAGLSPEAQARFASARERLGQPAGRYAVSHPLAAGLMLHNDWLEANALTTTDPAKLIRLLAREQGKPVVQRTYDLGPLLGALARTPRAAGEACLSAVLEEVEAGPGAIRAASRAWARGDVAGALAAERTWERCIAATPGAQAFDARFKTDMIADIRKALSRPGVTVAVVPLRPLLSEGGVLDRLRQDGFRVETPADIRAAEAAADPDAGDRDP